MIKKFIGINYQLDAINEDGNKDNAGRLGGTIPKALHQQASYIPITRNRAYGGTINFRRGLTNAILQEFIRISRIQYNYIYKDEGKR